MMEHENEESLPLPTPSSSNDPDQSFIHPLSSPPSIPSPQNDVVFSQNPSFSSSSSIFNSILEPPSYAEAIFKSFDDSSEINEDNGHVITTSPSSSSIYLSSSAFVDYLKVSVADPVQEQEMSNSMIPGSNSYYSYLITTLTDLEEYGGDEFSVRRRFRDVVALSDRLGEVYRGFFVPVRPDRGVVESRVMQKGEFLEQRRVALEKYLRKLANHPVIRRSEELRVFLTVEGRMPLFWEGGLDGEVVSTREVSRERSEGVGDGNEVVQVSKGGGMDFFRMFKELKQSVSYDWGGMKPPLVEEDKEFLEKKAKLQDFEQQITNVSLQAESLVKAQQDIGETMGQLGLAFVKLTKFESERADYECQRKLAADMKNVATASVKASRLYRELNTQTVKHLDQLHEYLGVMLAVNSAFSERTSALLSVQTLLSDVSSLNSKIEKLEAASSKIFGGDSSRIRKIEELRDTVRATEDAKDNAVKEYERIKENNKNELQRLDKEKQHDFLNMLRGFIVNQAGYAEKMANVWEEVAQETSTYVKT
ncbi:scaffold/adaptor protein [Lithospermum erythrorhizon]|uniref:Scaffold/adaptor protein n=1 Tax=Lithospermum erythrorhizon TaxID=34254 RepID=A0AAV3NK58_LITER